MNPTTSLQRSYQSLMRAPSLSFVHRCLLLYHHLRHYRRLGTRFSIFGLRSIIGLYFFGDSRSSIFSRSTFIPPDNSNKICNAKMLAKNGFLVLSNIIDKKESLQFLSQCREYLPSNYYSKSSSASYCRGQNLPQHLCRSILPDCLLGIIQVQALPGFTLCFLAKPYFAYTNINQSIANRLPDLLHLDHPFQFRATFLFSDVDKSTPRMQVVPYSHTVFGLFARYFDLVDMTGDIGSIVIHNGNLFHRLWLGQSSSFRLTLNLSLGFVRSSQLQSIDHDYYLNMPLLT